MKVIGKTNGDNLLVSMELDEMVNVIGEIGLRSLAKIAGVNNVDKCDLRGFMYALNQCENTYDFKVNEIYENARETMASLCAPPHEVGWCGEAGRLMPSHGSAEDAT